jgi:EmrB/QacA subfamily drug resistance transporter
MSQVASGHRAPEGASGVGASSPSRFGLLLTASLVSSLIMLDSNIVAVSLPAIGRSLGASFTDIQWVISAYVLTYAALLLAAGNFADLRGRRQAMVLGLVVFAVASGACGLATTATLLNLARAVQGIGGALLLTASLAIISNAFKGAERTHAFAFWGASLGIALAVGPIAGGTIADLFGWRWVFFVNLPACVGLIIATYRVIDESRDPNAKQLDFPGIFTFSLGLALLIWGLIDANDAGWTSTSILLRLGAAFVLFVAFVIVELRQHRPMVDFSLFRRRTFTGAILAMIGYGASAQVMVFFLPLFLQNAYGFAPIYAGIAMIPFAVPMVLTPRVTAKLAAHFSGRALLTAGLAISLVGNILFWIIAREDLPYPLFAFGMFISGCGAGLLNGQTVKVLQGAVPEDRAGMASGLASTTRFIGILVSVALLGAVLSSVTRAAFGTASTMLGLSPDAAAAAGKLVTSGNLERLRNIVPAGTLAEIHDAALAAYAQGFGTACLLAAALAAIACLLTFSLISTADTAASGIDPMRKIPCKTVDCRDPL